MRTFAVSICWLAVMAGCAARDRLADEKKFLKEGGRCRQGSFIQLLDQHVRWSVPAWQSLFDHLVQLQVAHIVVQWSAINQHPFYRAVPVPSAPEMPLDSILRLADANGMRVTVGLSHDLAYWTRIARADRRDYLLERLRINRQTATELRAIAIAHPSFDGWYISEEIDDLNWTDANAKLDLFNYLLELSSHLRKLTPAAHVGVSGFVNRTTEPAALRDFWIELFARAPAIDRLYFQDGIGVDKLSLTELPRYYGVLRDASNAAGRELIPVVEAFRQTAGPPMSKGEFKAEPTTLRRLSEQIGIANSYAARYVIFGMPEYMLPSAGPQAARLYQQYRATVKTAGKGCNFTNSK